MAKERTESYYDQLVARVSNTEGLEGIANDLVGDDGVKQALAINNARGIYSQNEEVSPGELSDITDGELRNYVASAAVQESTDMEYFFVENFEEIIDSIPSRKLEKGLLEYLPAVGFRPLVGEDDKLGEVAKRHQSYLNAKEMTSRYQKGESIGEENERVIRANAADVAREEAIKDLKDQGYNPKADAKLFALRGQAAMEVAFRKSGRETIREYLVNYESKQLEEFEKAAKDAYSDGIAGYGRETMEKYAANNAPSVARAIAQLKRL